MMPTKHHVVQLEVYNKAMKGGNKGIDITDSISQRKSVRAFRPDAVPQDVLIQIASLLRDAGSIGD